MPMELSLLIGIVFGAVASLMAFLIVFNEYQRHRLGRGRIWRESLAAGAVAFIVFVALSLIAGYWASHFVP